MSTEGVWAYGVVNGEAAEHSFGPLRGVAAEPVRLVSGSGLTAIVGTVGLDEFGEDGLRKNLEDSDWSAATACAHNSVISAIARSGAVVPLRMATVYLDDSRIRELLEARHDDFVAALNRVTAREELGVKAYANPKVLTGENESGESTGEKLSGTAYLTRRRRALASQDDAYCIAAMHAERIHAGLLAHAVDGKRRPARDRRLSGRKGWTVLNGAYLVENDELDAFRTAVATINRNTPGIELEITGPWPPYSFAGDVLGR